MNVRSVRDLHPRDEQVVSTAALLELLATYEEQMRAMHERIHALEWRLADIERGNAR